MQHSWAVDIDLRHWFYQFPLAPSVQRYFTTRSKRGAFSVTRMPMGWSYSMYIAQTTAEALLAPIAAAALAYVDGFLVGGATAAECSQHAAVLLDRLSRVNATINHAKSHLEPSQLVTFCGLNIDLALKRWRLDPDWSAKVLPDFLLLSSQLLLPVRAWFRLAGIAVWAFRASLLPLTAAWPLFQWMSYTMKGAVPAAFDWDQAAVLPPSAKRVLHAAADIIAANPWREWLQPACTVHLVTVAAWLGQRDGRRAPVRPLHAHAPALVPGRDGGGAAGCGPRNGGAPPRQHPAGDGQPGGVLRPARHARALCRGQLLAGRHLRHG
jgi:hypothetical protein